MNPFHIDNHWQQNIRDLILKPFYKKRAFEGRFVFADKGKLADILQKELAVDTILQGKENKIFSIEEKIVRWKGRRYESFALEIMSCTNPGRKKKGWMHYAQCDYLMYCFQQADGSLEAHAIPFPALQKWFFENYQQYTSTFTEQDNHTECKLVPIADVWASIEGCKMFQIARSDTT